MFLFTMVGVVEFGEGRTNKNKDPVSLFVFGTSDKYTLLLYIRNSKMQKI
jgi:hypothetical protein